MNLWKRWMGGTAVLLILLLAACGNPDSTSIPTQAPIAAIKEEEAEPLEEVAEETMEEEVAGEETAVESADGEEVVDDTALAPLPALDQSQVGGAGGGLGGGAPVGGGGGIAESGLAQESAAVDASIMPIVELFDGTTFTLDTELPTEPVRAPVEQKSEFSMTFEQAQQIALQFGFDGTLYQQPTPDGIDFPNQDPLLNLFFAFDNSGRTLNIDGYGIYYSDTNFQYEDQPSLTFDELAPVAEAFLTERGMLDFEYELKKGWGNEIWVMRKIRGVAFNQPEMTVGIDNDGNVFYVSMQQFGGMENLGNYPLRSAEDAWAQIADGVAPGEVPYSFAPIFGDLPIIVEPAPEGPYRYWQRTYQAGDTATLYAWPTVYVSADGSTAPRIEAFPFTVTGSAEDLTAIAEQPYTQYRFEGTVGENGRVLNLTNWEIISDYPENLYLQGSVQVDGDQTLFVANDGSTYIVPNAPADLPLDQQFNIFAWEAVDTGAAYPELVWENMDVQVNFDDAVIEEPVIIDDAAIFDPTSYESMTINDVSLVYFITFDFPEYDENNPLGGQPTMIAKPVWQFRGETNTGDVIDLFVDAVSQEFVE